MLLSETARAAPLALTTHSFATLPVPRPPKLGAHGLPHKVSRAGPSACVPESAAHSGLGGHGRSRTDRPGTASFHPCGAWFHPVVPDAPLSVISRARQVSCVSLCVSPPSPGLRSSSQRPAAWPSTELTASPPTGRCRLFFPPDWRRVAALPSEGATLCPDRPSRLTGRCTKTGGLGQESTQGTELLGLRKVQAPLALCTQTCSCHSLTVYLSRGQRVSLKGRQR